MEGRDRPRVVTQRPLPGESRPPPAPATVDPVRPAGPIGVKEPTPPSNQAILDRQRRWFEERARFDARRSDDEGPK